MMRIALMPGNMPRDVEFPKGIARSVEGSLTLLVGSYKTVTPEELEHIKTAMPDLYAKLNTIADEPAKTSPQPLPEQPAEEEQPEQ